MEIRLKVERARCEISNEEEKALIKLQTENGETPWMGISALKKAHDILAPMVGERLYTSQPQQPAQSPQQPSVQSQVLQEREPEYQPPQQRQGQLTVREIEDLKIFQAELVELVENPPRMSEGSSGDGLSEKDIRGLIGDHYGRFRDPQALYPILSRVLGMSKDRFDQIIKMVRR